MSAAVRHHDATRTAPMAWQRRLHALLAARRSAPFRWGQFDCCIFAADDVHAVSGVDHAATWRGTYSTPEAAARLVQRLGGLEAIASAAGPRITPALADMGDIGLVQVAPDRQALAVCTGGAWVLPGATLGLAIHTMTAAVAAWRVPRA